MAWNCRGVVYNTKLTGSSGRATGYKKGGFMDVCKWTPWDEVTYGTGTYDTSCGNVHCLTEGDIAENGYKFCPHCGKKILEKNIIKKGANRCFTSPVQNS